MQIIEKLKVKKAPGVFQKTRGLFPACPADVRLWKKFRLGNTVQPLGLGDSGTSP
ncbi:MAG: hypothetical protein LBR82_08955 [Desulfovibrio sp.]|jgi:hypothetical protein|nr:hypothetical protein [Desulfovibrio sp.]